MINLLIKFWKIVFQWKLILDKNLLYFKNYQIRVEFDIFKCYKYYFKANN